MAAGHSPLEQFEVKPVIPLPSLAGQDITFTNASMFMVLAGGVRRGALVPGYWQSMVEVYYEFVSNMVRENIGTKGRAFFPFIFTLFTFLLFSNLLGMWPYHGFTVTSHIIVTFGLAIVIFIGATLVGFMKHGLHFLHLFVPEGAPKVLIPLLILIELMSYLARPITLSLRLAGNMMAG
ncbi:MAG: F0F1 ATP synthase subunit A, partial [Rickettsiales bacterium]